MATKNNKLSYKLILADVVDLLDRARRTSARTVNSVMTSTYWEIGRRIVEYEQGGKLRAGYGKKLLIKLSLDLSERFGRGFSVQNLANFRSFFLQWPIFQTLSGKLDQPLTLNPPGIRQTPSADLTSLLDDINDPKTDSNAAMMRPGKKRRAIPQTVSGKLASRTIGLPRYPLPWSHYVRLMAVENPEARKFYEAEAIRASWSVRQLDRQISTLFYERTALSRNKAAMLKKGAQPKTEDLVTPEEEIKDPLILEFLGLKDEYSESELEEALIRHLQTFLLELGDDFAFIGRQRRLRIGDEWYRVTCSFTIAGSAA